MAKQAEIQTKIKELQAACELWLNKADALESAHSLIQQQLRTQTKVADEMAYQAERQAARVDALLYALVLAQTHSKTFQDAYNKLKQEHSRCDKLSLASGWAETKWEAREDALKQPKESK